jgi:nucleoid DNA-binding protein
MRNGDSNRPWTVKAKTSKNSKNSSNLHFINEGNTQMSKKRKPLQPGDAARERSLDELAGQVALQTGQTKAVVREIMNSLSREVSSDLVRCGKSKLIGMGLIRVKPRPPRRGRNPRTGEKLVIGKSVQILFRPTEKFRNTLKEKVCAGDNGQN